MSLLKLFCNVDDFWQAFQPHWRRVTLARSGAFGLAGRGCAVSVVLLIPLVLCP